MKDFFLDFDSPLKRVVTEVKLPKCCYPDVVTPLKRCCHDRVMGFVDGGCNIAITTVLPPSSMCIVL